MASLEDVLWFKEGWGRRKTSGRPWSSGPTSGISGVGARLPRLGGKDQTWQSALGHPPLSFRVLRVSREASARLK